MKVIDPIVVDNQIFFTVKHIHQAKYFNQLQKQMNYFSGHDTEWQFNIEQDNWVAAGCWIHDIDFDDDNSIGVCFNKTDMKLTIRYSHFLIILK